MNKKELTEAAEKMQPHLTRNAVKNGKLNIQWTDDDHFIYSKDVESENGWVKKIYSVNCETGIETEIETSTPERSASGRSGIRISPDGQKGIAVRGYNIFLVNMEDGKERQLTFDGQDKAPYASPSHHALENNLIFKGCEWVPDVLWSPDSEKILTYRYDERNQKPDYLVKSWYEAGGKAEVEYLPYYRQQAQKTEVSYYELLIIYVETGRMIFLSGCQPSDEVSFGFRGDETARWLPDSSGFWYTRVGRAFKEAYLDYVDARTGQCETIVRESSEHFLNVSDCIGQTGYGRYRFSNMITPDGRYAVWQSERSGKAHFYLYDTNTHELLRDITPFSGIACRILCYDQDSHMLYYTANDIPGQSEPYYHVLCSTCIDTGEVKVLTPEDGEHQISTNGKWFVDTYSRVDTPPVTVLRNLDGNVEKVLARADIQELISLGYIVPEPFRVKAADGETDLYGILIRPADMKAGEHYPLVDYVYGGPQMYITPKSFTFDALQGRELSGGLETMALCGICGMIMDGRGTPGRGTDFHWYSDKNLHGCCGLEDHVCALKQLKELYPFLDLSQVGIWGSSAGGAMAARAILEYPEVYCAAVASAGDYDNRIYAAGWAEHYYGPYDEELYRKGDVASLTGNLQGKLMLAHGLMDWNVIPAQVIRLVDSLVLENKDFDLLLLPRCGHNVPGDRYFQRRKLEFFAKHLGILQEDEV